MITEDFVNCEGYRIWYRVAKSVTSDSITPILLLHGGPGLGSDYLNRWKSSQSKEGQSSGSTSLAVEGRIALAICRFGE